MGIINSNKSIGGITSIDCQGVLNVTLGITAAPDIISHPADIVLLLDRSTSMLGQPLADMKTGVNTFIDIIASATGGSPGTIGAGSHIGIVSFATTAVQDTALITSVADLKTAVDALVADGFTNHGDAFTQATALLSSSPNNKVIVMFTDGETTTGPEPSPIASAARALGITIYCIGLIGSTGIDVNALNDWATDPNVTHVAVAPDSSQLEQIFADLAANISVPGATNIIINEAINPDFAIASPPVATMGTVSQITTTSFQWAISQLGTTSTESATVSFAIQHVAADGGTKLIDQSLSYTDNEGNAVSFANPDVLVTCVPTNAQLSVTKSADRSSVCSASEDITYTLVVSNSGNVPLTDVLLYDSIPQGLCYKPGTTTKDGGTATNANPQSGIYIGTLDPDESSTATFILNICHDMCHTSTVTEFVNTAWAKGMADEEPVSAVSDPWIVSLDVTCVTKNIVEHLPVCDASCSENGYIYHTGTTYHSSLAKSSVKACYEIVLTYMDCCHRKKSKHFEGSVTFSDLPGNLNQSNSKICFTNLTCQSDNCGNIRAEFEATICYCNKA